MATAAILDRRMLFQLQVWNFSLHGTSSTAQVKFFLGRPKHHSCGPRLEVVVICGSDEFSNAEMCYFK